MTPSSRKPDQWAWVKRIADSAAMHPGIRSTTVLVNGLKVEAVRECGRMYLCIWHPQRQPKIEEWQAILRHWPYPVESYPERGRDPECWWLEGSWWER